MKKAIFYFILTLSIWQLSCKKENETEGSKDIYGIWRLTESYVDPGNGSGKYKEVTGEPKYLIFDKSGNVKGTAFSNLVSFRILDSVVIKFVVKDSNQSVNYRYKISERSLTLNPPCFEGCGFKFVRN